MRWHTILTAAASTVLSAYLTLARDWPAGAAIFVVNAALIALCVGLMMACYFFADAETRATMRTSIRREFPQRLREEVRSLVNILTFRR